MADGVSITAGSGTTILTDDTGAGGHAQVVKLAISTDGSPTLIPADATNGIDVDVTRVGGQVQVGDGTNAIAIDTSPVDAEANAANALVTLARNSVFNGTTWDRVRGDVTNGMDVDVTRVQGTVAIGDGTNGVIVDVTGADGEGAATAALVTNARLKIYNGTSWDRMRGDITNGVDVDVTRVQGQVAVGDGTDAVSVLTAPADAASNTANVLEVLMRALEFNGTTWDRKRGVATVNKVGQYTTAQTGTALWTPAAGRAIVVTSIQIQSYGTTAGLCQVWFGGSADTTYTRGTDAAVFDGEWAPSTTNKPGVFVAFPTPVRGTADFVLRVTTTNAQSVTINVWGYEV